MSAVLVYRQAIYTEMDFTDTTFQSITGTLPWMFLNISGIIRISSRKLERSKSEGLQAFEHWMYHVGEFTQWIDGSTQVLLLSTLASVVRILLYNISLTCKTFSVRLYFDTTQPNYIKRLPTIRPNDLIYIVCACPVMFEEDEVRNFFDLMFADPHSLGNRQRHESQVGGIEVWPIYTYQRFRLDI